MEARTPAGINDVTKEWVEAMLTEVRGSTVRVKNIDVSQATRKGDNFCSVLALLDVNTEDGEEINLMLKLAPEGDGIKQRFFEQALLFEKEAFAYMHLLKDLDRYQMEKFGKVKVSLPFPKCLYIKKEKDGRAVIVMENLRKIGFKMFDKKKETDYEHAVAALNGLSKLHAVSYAMKKDKRTEYTSVYPWIKNSFITEMEEMEVHFQRAFNPLLMVLEGMPDTEEYAERVKAYHKSHRLRERYEVLSAPKEPMALVTHGDFWNNNMLFKYSEDSLHPTDFRMLDLQLCRYTLGVIDLLYYMYSSTTGAFRERHLNQVLRVYYDSFINYLKLLEVDFDSAEYSFEQLLQDFDDKVELGFIMGAWLIPVVMTKEDQVPDYDNVNEENMKEAMENFEKLMKENASPEVQQRVMDLVKEMANRKII